MLPAAIIQPALNVEIGTICTYMQLAGPQKKREASPPQRLIPYILMYVGRYCTYICITVD